MQGVSNAATRDASTDPADASAPRVRSAGVRQDRILDFAETRPQVRVEELVEMLGVSRMTVHRDLAALVERGVVERVRGGIRRVAPRLTETDFQVRRSLRTTTKKALAARAVTLVGDGDILALDDSSTVSEMIDPLASRRDLTIVTHSLFLMRAISERRLHTALIGLGGHYYPETDSFLGHGVAQQAAELRADSVFVTSTAVRGGQLYHPDYEAGMTKRVLLGIADRKVLLLDATRFTGQGVYRVAPLSDFDDIIVDAAAGPEHIDAIREHTDAVIHVVDIL